MIVGVLHHGVIFVLFFDPGIVNLSFDILPGLYIRNHKMLEVEICRAHWLGHVCNVML